MSCSEEKFREWKNLNERCGWWQNQTKQKKHSAAPDTAVIPFLGDPSQSSDDCHSFGYMPVCAGKCELLGSHDSLWAAVFRSCGRHLGVSSAWGNMSNAPWETLALCWVSGDFSVIPRRNGSTALVRPGGPVRPFYREEGDKDVQRAEAHCCLRQLGLFSLEERKLQGDLTTLSSALSSYKRAGREVFTRAWRSRTSRNGFNWKRVGLA